MNAPIDAPRPQRIFIVDDHPLFRMGLRGMLGATGQFELCGEAEDAESALTQLRTSTADLVIMDITLRGMSGIELLKQVRAELPHLRTILMSMHDEELYAERALRAGALGYVKKDSPPERVLDAIHQALRSDMGSGSGASQATSDEARAARSKPRSDDAALKALSGRELEIFAHMGDGASTRDCADRLGISIKTVEAHQANIKIKLGLRGSHQLRRYAVLWASKKSTSADAGADADANQVVASAGAASDFLTGRSS
jgi:DNA-binding NarL/FixJ family response regulator